jgi:hypothetical protein
MESVSFLEIYETAVRHIPGTNWLLMAGLVLLLRAWGRVKLLLRTMSFF